MNPIVTNPCYLGYDQAGLDAQYNNRLRWPDFKAHFANWRVWSTQTCTLLPFHLDLALCPDPMLKLGVIAA